MYQSLNWFSRTFCGRCGVMVSASGQKSPSREEWWQPKGPWIEYLTSPGKKKNPGHSVMSLGKTLTPTFLG